MCVCVCVCALGDHILHVDDFLIWIYVCEQGTSSARMESSIRVKNAMTATRSTMTGAAATASSRVPLHSCVLIRPSTVPRSAVHPG